MARQDTDRGEDFAPVGALRAAVIVGAVALSCLLPLLPVLVATGFASGSVARTAAGVAAGVGAVLGGGKLAAAAWGLAVRWEAPPSS